MEMSTGGGDERPDIFVQENAQPSSAASAGDAAKEVQALRDVFRSLSPRAVTDLVSLGVCIRCILRLLRVQGHIFSSSFLSTSILSSLIGELISLDRNMVDGCDRENEDTKNTQISRESEVESGYCCICLGILQFTYCDDQKILVEDERANQLVASIAELVKKEGYQMDNFSLEVSMPPIVMENEEIVWSYIRRKYESEPWFQENILPGHLSVKDALKFSTTNSLENLLGVNSGHGSLRIRLTYACTKSPMMVQISSDTGQGCKRRKTDCSPFSSSEVDKTSNISVAELLDNEVSEHQLLPKMVNQACHLTYHCYRTPIYIGGRYLKYSRNVSQTRWVIDDERMGEASVEEIVGNTILLMCRGDNYKFQAAGREDIDVRMLGSGRPFLFEVQNARLLPSAVLVKEMEKKINNLETKLVKVKNLRVLGSEGRSLMQEGEAEKQKQYAALVWISRLLKDEDLQTISTVKDMKILQRTPIRVLHRRSPLEREKIIHWMKIVRITGSSHYFFLHLCTQAGTYIKEFVHGDLGRCHPSIGSILGCRAEIIQLDVTDVKMDCFL